MIKALSKKLKNQPFYIDFAFITIVLAGSFIVNSVLLFKYDFPLGIDGYYYLVQVKSLLSEGSLYYPTNFPAVLYLAAGISRLVIEPVIAIKILSLLFYSVFTVSIFLIIGNLTNERKLGFIAAFIVIVSVLRASWVIEFINNLSGVAFLFFGIFCFIKSSQNKVWLILAICSLIFACFCHKSILPLTILIFLCYVVFYRFGELNVSPVIYGFLVISITVFLLLVFFLTFQTNILPSFSKDIFSNEPAFPLLIKGFFEEKFILTFLSPLGIFIGILQFKNQKTLCSIIITTCMLTIFITLNPFLHHTPELMTIPDRLSLLMPVQIALIFCLLLKLSNFDYIVKMALSGFIFFLLLIGNNQVTKGRDENFLMQRQTLIKSLAEAKLSFPKDSIIIAPHGYQFALTYTLGISSQQNMPKNEKQTFWLIFGVPCEKSKEPVFILPQGTICTVIADKNKIETLTSAERQLLLKLNPFFAAMSEDFIEQILPLEK